MRRSLAVTLLAAAAFAVTADSLAWVWATNQIETGVAAWLADRRVEGWAATAGPAQRGGWPFRAEVAYPDMVLSGGLSWQADRVRLRFDPLRREVLTVALEGIQRIRLGTLPAATLVATRLTALAPLDDSAGPVIVHATGLRAEAGGQSVSAARATLRIRPGVAEAEAEGVDLPAGPQWPFGRDIASVAATARLEGSLPAMVDDLPHQAAAWRDAGGKLVITQSALHWGALDAQGSGDVTLDPALQPRASFVVQLAGYPETIAALVQSRAIRPNDARVATTLLGLLAQTSPGGKPEVTVPLNLRGGVLSAGGIPIARVPGLAWGPATPGG